MKENTVNYLYWDNDQHTKENTVNYLYWDNDQHMKENTVNYLYWDNDQHTKEIPSIIFIGIKTNIRHGYRQLSLLG